MTDLIGTPYKARGRDESGLDCFGLIWLIALRQGTPIKDPVYKGFDPSLVKLADQIGLKKLEGFEVGCVLEINKDNRLHLGYATDRDKMIHCVINEGVVLEDIKNYEIRGYYGFNNAV